MRKSRIIIPAMLLSLSMGAATAAEAAKYCQGDHLHYGFSDSFKSKRQAMRDAVKSWASFTAFEYGPEWARWRLSINRSVKCGRENGLWRCNIQSTPCRRAKRGERGKYK
ncbi:MAG: hypothetical protein DHS20C08_00360 [Rhodomicrobium sp.]|nr:MAG: hypothetical protein DHS20C08_00360 [Rhodomicrobium sp.]